MSKYKYVNGTVSFANLDEHEEFNGQSTGAYSIVITLDDEGAEQLEAEGVRLKTYKETMQRKFKSKYDVLVVDADKEAIRADSVRWGDKVVVKYSLGAKHPQWGVTPYLTAVQVLEHNEVTDQGQQF